MIPKPDMSRLLTLSFEADDEFMAEYTLLRDEAAAHEKAQAAFDAEARRKYQEAIDRFKARLLSGQFAEKEPVH